VITRKTQRYRDRLANVPSDFMLRYEIAYWLFRQNTGRVELPSRHISEKPRIKVVHFPFGFRAAGVYIERTFLWFWFGNQAEYEELLKSK
jgi:hypothetical protein